MGQGRHGDKRECGDSTFLLSTKHHRNGTSQVGPADGRSPSCVFAPVPTSTDPAHVFYQCSFTLLVSFLLLPPSCEAFPHGRGDTESHRELTRFV